MNVIHLVSVLFGLATGDRERQTQAASAARTKSGGAAGFGPGYIKVCLRNGTSVVGVLESLTNK